MKKLTVKFITNIEVLISRLAKDNYIHKLVIIIVSSNDLIKIPYSNFCYKFDTPIILLFGKIQSKINATKSKIIHVYISDQLSIKYLQIFLKV